MLTQHDASRVSLAAILAEYVHLMSTDARELNPDAPAHYRICAQGLFDARWLEMLSGVWVLCDRQCSGLRVTILVGSVSDQAALFGVLNHLYDLGMPLISVEWLTDAPATPTQSGVEHRHSPAPDSEHRDRRSSS